MSSASRRISDNPLTVLGLPAGASRIEIEREGQKLIGMLELGFAEAQTYATPLGPRPRTVELVRAAIAALRDPAHRLVAELWLGEAAPAAAAPAPVDEARHEEPAAWPDAPALLDWSPRR
jgi:hypothetical protein